MNQKFSKIFFTSIFIFSFIFSERASAAAMISAQDSNGIQAVALDYTKLIQKNYAQVLADVRAMHDAIYAFTKNPSQQTLDTARVAWKKARDSYSPTEPYRFYGGPIDAPQKNVEELMNAWPIDESYIDYVKDQPTSGIVNHADKFPVIDAATLIAANEKGGERNVSTGFHAIEFLLWGQDFSMSKPGNRSYEDYLPAKNPQAERRAKYLQTVADALLEHCEYLVNSWKEGSEYPKSFQAASPDEILRRILTGVTSLSADEMSGERLTAPLEKHDPKNQQDCFSAYTLTDLASNQKGVIAVYEKSGLRSLFEKKDAALAKKIHHQLENSLKLISEIPYPFDKILVAKDGDPSRKKVQDAIQSLGMQAHLIAQMAGKFGVQLNVQ